MGYSTLDYLSTTNFDELHTTKPCIVIFDYEEKRGFFRIWLDMIYKVYLKNKT